MIAWRSRTISLPSSAIEKKRSSSVDHLESVTSTAKRLLGDQTAPSSMDREPAVCQYRPRALQRTAPSEIRIRRFSTLSGSGSSAEELPGARQANAKRLEGDIVPSTTRAAPGPLPQVRPPSLSGWQGPISAFTGEATAAATKTSVERKAPIARMRASPEG